ncbi:hypothetical protein L3Q65_00555 (plasmid) [Amycolatopsis sp. FU40]|uniref:hypothetical protein n=1 Tax=Amycolatopsis sp. FU40 TaxID=2914159 RepID=UPI001F2B4864|nr:hypothetical protein [Amycolatopsis sp. FU40]UKD50819.1 hypothetical protein L3Q65_00555 [Amycolatopsis sp. FU40]
MSRPDAADSHQAYTALFLDGLADCLDHLVAASLASDVAELEFVRAGEADTAAGRRMFLAAADKARATRDFHELAAAVEAALEPAAAS